MTIYLWENLVDIYVKNYFIGFTTVSKSPKLRSQALSFSGAKLINGSTEKIPTFLRLMGLTPFAEA